MHPFDSARVADKQLGIAFHRVRCGYEKTVRSSLASGPKPGARRFYKCFGHYDIVEFSSTDLPVEPSLSKSADIMQTIRLSAIRWAVPPVSQPLPDWFFDAPVVLMVLLKLHHDVLLQYGLRGEMQALRYLQDRLAGGHPSLATCLGHSEIVLLLKGEDLSQLLTMVSFLRDKCTVGDVYGNTPEFPVSGRESLPVFSRTLSFPLISYDLVLDNNDFSHVKGCVRPIIAVRCRPGAEKAIALSFREHELGQAFPYFGKEDLLVWGNESIEVSKLVSSLMSFRDSWADRVELYSTATRFLGPDQTEGRDLKPTDDSSQKAILVGCRRGAQALVNLLDGNWLEVDARRQVIGLSSRLANCAADPHVCLGFADMLDFVDYLGLLLQDISLARTRADTDNLHLGTEKLLDELHVANEATFQRSSGIEVYLEGFAAPPVFFLAGTNRVLMAAADLPSFAINDVLSKMRDGRSWSGFVTFSDSFPFQAFEGSEIISVPSRVRFKPVDEWPTIGHEISHIAYHILGFDKYSAKAEMSIVEGLQGDPAFPPDEIQLLVYELFAHWFDFAFFHEGADMEYFLERVWLSWLNVPMIWKRKGQYLLRSLLLTIWGKYSEFVATTEARGEREEFVESCYRTMISRLSSRVPDFREFMREIAPQDEADVLLGARYLGGQFRGFEKFRLKIDEQACARLGKAYEGIDRHSDMLLKGEVVYESIPNPMALLRRLQKGLHEGNKPATDATQLAVILSLANDYLFRQNARLRK